ncbi:unnamed protein product [Trichogramma brassicae]|uniref:RING-type domain-containing protein n=1 Tax=Trichogramma brassicae TaxID=86971 RepID=A0A6H5I8C7_9HYME|nr:unnamed protein product [Trichogramma brassicae]
MTCFFLSDFFSRSKHKEERLTLSLPGPALELGTPPRLCYPLVIFLTRTDTKDLHPDETQLYLATGNSTNYDEAGVSTGIGPLALAEPCPSSSNDSTSRDAIVASGAGDSSSEGSLWNSAGEQLCVVCQYFPLSRALLPCRHTCICAVCFCKLDRCPMCRSPIKSYFCIRGEEYMPEAQETNSCKQRQAGGRAHEANNAASHWLHDWNDRLTDFLGFTR